MPRRQWPAVQPGAHPQCRRPAAGLSGGPRQRKAGAIRCIDRSPCGRCAAHIVLTVRADTLRPPRRPGVAAGRRRRTGRDVRAGGAARSARRSRAAIDEVRVLGALTPLDIPGQRIPAASDRRGDRRAAAAGAGRRRSRAHPRGRRRRAARSGAPGPQRRASATASACASPAFTSRRTKSGARPRWCWPNSSRCWAGPAQRRTDHRFVHVCTIYRSRTATFVAFYRHDSRDVLAQSCTNVSDNARFRARAI